jgi:hypothetical protein
MRAQWGKNKTIFTSKRAVVYARGVNPAGAKNLSIFSRVRSIGGTRRRRR